MADTTATPAQQQYPNLNPYGSANGNGSVTNAKDTLINSKFLPADSPLPIHPSNPPLGAQSTMDSLKNSNTVQSLSNGPMADKARNEASATQSEFSNLAASRTKPDTTTANGQELTHYHSFFYDLLSWNNPRATAISYASIVLFIIVGRYVPITRYVLKALYIVLGITAAAETAGRLVLGQGVASKMRPKRYYTIPHETLESLMTDMVELANFFVIEFQRVVFAENIGVTIGAFTTALVSYFLVKVTPAWGLTLLFATVAYFAPLIYIQNREFIDTHVANAQDIIGKQASQVRDLAAEHTNKAMQASQSAVKEYSSRAQELVGSAKQTAVEKGYVSAETAGVNNTTGTNVTKEDFPTAPTAQPTHDGAADELPVKEEMHAPYKADEKEPLLA